MQKARYNFTPQVGRGQRGDQMARAGEAVGSRPADTEQLGRSRDWNQKRKTVKWVIRVAFALVGCHAALPVAERSAWAALRRAISRAFCHWIRSATTCSSRWPVGMWSGSPDLTDSQGPRYAGPAPAAGSALEARPPRAGPQPTAGPEDQNGYPVAHAGTAVSRLPRLRLCNSRPPRQGWPFRAAATRWLRHPGLVIGVTSQLTGPLPPLDLSSYLSKGLLYTVNGRAIL
jgi:hypothetical protein